ncbi:Dimeric alpha+beta barrel-containing protein [Dioscorea alata]|uniref:Dimeric alpha+beta barrel-containing protein n=2 Tax=Dioscorea alata TaxID=55571 RepID=A0ACB7U217_DIOAL|nr:Dimeric alpha+beta barrel-containing protein [Dioscorea alata]KAH7654335.1 Dimeric alpha+beta barrel-containing protein [Dioscorea alata]
MLRILAAFPALSSRASMATWSQFIPHSFLFFSQSSCIYIYVINRCLFFVFFSQVVWYGAWIKRSTEDRKTLADNLVAALSQITHLAILLNQGFFEAFIGESKDGRPAAKFSTGDILFLVSMPSISNDTSDLSYACLALLRSHFSKEGGLSSSVCLQCKDQPMVATLQVWESLQACYSWLLSSDYRNTYLPYIRPLTCDTQFDIFKVVYVSSDEVPYPDSFQRLQGGVREQR